MLRFEEVMTETLTVRRIGEQVGLGSFGSAKDYYSVGVDFFPLLTNKLGITLDELYAYHSNSDLEGLAVKIGEKLPGDQPAVIKGLTLFIAIHQEDSERVRQTGAMDLLK